MFPPSRQVRANPVHLSKGMAMTIMRIRTLITGGVDTHLEFHVAAAVDANGGVLGVETFSTRSAGYAQLVAWLQRFGPIDRVGVEGTGSYGTGSPDTCAAKASLWSRSIDPTVKPGAATASPTPSTPSQRLEPR